MSRTTKSTLNSLVGLICSILSSILSFFLRGAFIRLLGLEYAGAGSLFADILKILNLVDLGVSNAILVRLYRSCAKNDVEETELYLVIYKRVCQILAIVITIGGLLCLPFLNYLVKDRPTFPEPLWALFLIILTNSYVGHSLGYKSIIFTAKQERFIKTLIQYGGLFLLHGLQLLSLLIYRNIYLYLLIPLLTITLRFIVSDVIAWRRYHVQYKTKRTLSTDDKKELFKDVGSLSVYKICRTLDATVDTLLISRFVSVAMTGIYGSFGMIFGALNELLGVFNDGMIASIGDLHTSGEKRRLADVFYQSFHFTYLLFGICAVTLVPFVSDFVRWWIGHTLPDSCVYIIILNFVMCGFGMNVATFRNAMGIFQKGWLRPAFTAGLNLFFSLMLVMRIGLLGTLLGTTIARLLTLVWYDPYLVCRYGFSCRPYKYYLRYATYAVAIATFAWGLLFLRSIIAPMNGFVSALWHGILYLFCATIALTGVGFLFSEQKDIIIRIQKMLKTVHGKACSKVND